MMVRTPFSDQNGVRRGTWTPEEDKKLIDYITRHGSGNWRHLPRFAGLDRCGKSCRFRWMNYLRPDLKKGGFTQEEEDIIIRLHRNLGNRWSAIASNLPGRTDNEIKNHWHGTLKKRFQQQNPIPKQESNPEIVYVVQNNNNNVNYNNCTCEVSHHPQSSSKISDNATTNHNLVHKDDYGDLSFLHSYTKPVIESFLTEPYVAQSSYPTKNEVVVAGHHDDGVLMMSPQSDFAVFDSPMQPMIGSFLSDMSHINVPTDQLHVYSSRVNDDDDVDLWSQTVTLF